MNMMAQRRPRRSELEQRTLSRRQMMHPGQRRLLADNEKDSDYFLSSIPRTRTTRKRPTKRRGTARCDCRQSAGNSSLVGTISLPLLLLAFLSMVLPLVRAQGSFQEAQAADTEALQVDGFVDSSFCYDSMIEADADEDGRITPDEYVTLAQNLSPPGLVDDVRSFEDLPFAFQTTYSNIACFCQSPTFGGDAADSTCCVGDNAHIRVPEDPTDVNADVSQGDVALLYATCFLTTGTGEAVAVSPYPSAKPSTRPPTVAPTTLSPTAEPSASPSTSPPTVAPTTAEPTVAPTLEPTTTTPEPTTTTPEPTTLAPTTLAPSTVAPTTAAPTTASPTTATAPPTGPAAFADATVTYDIALKDVVVAPVANDDVYDDLVSAMDVLAVQVLDQVVQDPPQRRRLRALVRVRRKLVTSVDSTRLQLPITNIDCPADGTVPEGVSVCQEVTSVVTLKDEGEVPLAVKSRFESDLFQAVFDGLLQEELTTINPDTPIVVLTGRPGNSTTREVDTGGSDGLSSGGIAGIAIAGVVAVLVMAYVVGSRRPADEADSDDEMKKSPSARKAGYAAHANEPGSSSHGLASPDRELQSVDDSIYTDSAPQMSISTGSITQGAGNLGAGQQQSGDFAGKDGAGLMMERGDDILVEPEMEHFESDAGSSGWSSSAGISSLNTGSMDDSMDAAAAAGATLAALGAGSALAAAAAKSAKEKEKEAKAKRRDSKGGVSSSDDLSSSEPSATRDQLDHLIEVGDWAAVGATAALLAAASDSQSQSSRSHVTSRSAASSDVDAARAAELDHLVDAGDWEGVVLAAAKFQAGASDDQNKSAPGSSIDSSAGSDSQAGTAGTGTAGSPSISTSLSDTPSQAAKRAAIRSEVEALVRRVVPEEIDNVDEMMNQFKGREEELVETLRTMQERAVAQKARAAGHKQAKAMAKQSVQRGVVPGADRTAAAAGAAVAAGAAAAAIATSDRPADDDDEDAKKPAARSAQENRTALEMAIESGDWQAVGEAAAMMEEGSVGTMSTGELDRLADASTDESETSFVRNRSKLKGVDAERAKTLDSMIDVGDWKGVISAAGEFSASDRAKGKMSKEEEDALQQAELWAKIAKEKKAEGATDAGASDAAEWAIQRSLSQMKQAEEKKKPADEGGEGDEV